MIDPELKQKWIEALQSGEYVKGHGRLREPGDEENSEKYCCLGVLADISELGEWAGPVYVIEDFDYEGYFGTRVGLSVSTMMCLADINDRTDDFDEVIGMIRGVA